MKENMNEKDPIGIPITLRPLVGVVNKNGGEKSIGKLAGDQATHSCDCTKRPILMGWGRRYSNVIELSHNKKLVNGQAMSPPTCDF
jgi:hypothetical protein